MLLHGRRAAAEHNLAAIHVRCGIGILQLLESVSHPHGRHAAGLLRDAPHRLQRADLRSQTALFGDAY